MPFSVDAPSMVYAEPLEDSGIRLASDIELRTLLTSIEDALTTLEDTVPLTEPAAVALARARDATNEMRRRLKIEPRPVGRVLICDGDEQRLAELRPALDSAGFDLRVCDKGADIVGVSVAWRPQVILIGAQRLDPDPSLLTDLNQVTHATIVVFVGRARPRAINELLARGAHDYILDPWNATDLLRRLTAYTHTRRETDATIEHGPLYIDQTNKTVTLDGQDISLTPTEYRLLSQLAIESGRILTHRQLLHRVWGPQYVESDDYVWVHLSRLRQKLNIPGQPSLIVTERGVGYRLRLP
ncbi:MAG: response regulator transcription factor [Anaerolineae bacterium]